MNEDIDYDETSNRTVIITAVVAAIIVAVSAWYFFLRPSDTVDEAEEAVPVETEIIEAGGLNVGVINETPETTIIPIPESVQREIAASQNQPQVAADVSTNAPTGAGSLAAFAALASTLSGGLILTRNSLKRG